MFLCTFIPTAADICLDVVIAVGAHHLSAVNAGHEPRSPRNGQRSYYYCISVIFIYRYGTYRKARRGLSTEIEDETFRKGVNIVALEPAETRIDRNRNLFFVFFFRSLC